MKIGAKKILPVPQTPFEHDLVRALEDTFNQIDESVELANRPNLVSVATNYTVGKNDVVVIGTDTATVTLPLASPSKEREIIVKNTHASNTVVVAAQTGENIDGANTYSLSSQYDSLSVISDGTDWHILSTK